MTPPTAALLLALCASVAMASVPAWSSGVQQPVNWNGTWAGNWSGGDGAQIIFAGNEFIGFYWHGDYLADVHATLSPAGVVTLTWAAGSATLTRDSETTAHIVIREPGKPDLAFALKRDT